MYYVEVLSVVFRHFISQGFVMDELGNVSDVTGHFTSQYRVFQHYRRIFRSIVDVRTTEDVCEQLALDLIDKL